LNSNEGAGHGPLEHRVLFTSEMHGSRILREEPRPHGRGDSPRWLQFGTRDAALALRALEAGTAARIELGSDVPSLDQR